MTLKGILDPQSNFKDRFIPDYNELKSVTEELRENGHKIVLTQGVYDLLHIGHCLYLESAKSYGDILIVGVDSDALTRERKGPKRPIVPQEERLQMLVGLRVVDILTLRGLEHGIDALIECVEPDVLITSETTTDFPPEKIKTLSVFCGEMITLPAQATVSTTARIRNVEIGGADELAEELNKRIPSVVKSALRALKGGRL